MRTQVSRRILPPFAISLILCLATPAAFGDDWPISYAKLTVPASAYYGADRKAPTFDCQPTSFDPATTPYHHGKSPDSYEVEGAKEGTAMMIDGWNKEGDAKTELAEPYSLSKYMFTCPTGSSQVFEFKKGGKRLALFTHITQAQFTPDATKLVMYNYLGHHGAWQELRRIVDIGKKRSTPLPVMKETAFLAQAGSDRVVTYGLPAATPKQKGAHRIAAVWGANGKLIRALSVPVSGQNGAANGADDVMGTLPGEATTFYHLARSGENECTLRLQDIQHAEGRRTIKLAVPGAATDAAALGTRVQLDLAGTGLKGGAVKYRVSASGKGDDWGDWQSAE